MTPSENPQAGPTAQPNELELIQQLSDQVLAFANKHNMPIRLVGAALNLTAMECMLRMPNKDAAVFAAIVTENVGMALQEVIDLRKRGESKEPVPCASS